MAAFSWSDTFKIGLKTAFQSCFPCSRLNASDTASFQDADCQHSGSSLIPRARPDELQGLLADPDTDGEAETMSLHSNPGHTLRKKRKNRRKSKNPGKVVSLFGYNLFGRPPIQLANDSEDALYIRRGSLTPNTHSTTSSTFDSDAAPLDADAIDALSSPTTATAAIEALRLREKEERRRQRKEKKEIERLAKEIAKKNVAGEGEEFEGFQGSGGEPLQRQSLPTKVLSEYGSSSRSGPKSEPTSERHSLQPEADGVADLDGGVYTRNTSRSSSHRGSDSRSRTSASMSDRARQSNSPHLADPAGSIPTEGPLKHGKSKSSSSRTSKSRSSATTSQSPSQSSPIATNLTLETQRIVSPSTVEQGQGFFDLEDELPPRNQESAYFPITGFGGATGGRKASNVGVFLAERGDRPRETR